MKRCFPVFNGEICVGHLIECPACGHGHLFENDQHPNVPKRGGYGWTFNGDLEKPTFTPSMLVRWGGLKDGVEVTKICHSFVTDGKIQFLSDCTHHLAGQTVDLPEME